MCSESSNDLDDESYQWSEDSDFEKSSDSDIESYLNWEEDSVLTTNLDDDIDSEEEDSDLENLDEDIELATKNPQRRTTETLTENKEDKLLDAITINLLEMELILVDDEEPILIEEKTKQEEKGVSLTQTNRRKDLKAE